MDQLKSSEKKEHHIPLPARKYSVEFWVGIFTFLGVACMAYLAVGLGDVEVGFAGKYEIYADFDNISGLKKGSSVEIAGVQIGDVKDISLNDPAARVTMRIDKGVPIHDDDIASIRTKGIIGDRYVKISRGSSDVSIKAGQRMPETESVVDLEDVIGKFIHQLGGEKKEEKTEETK